MTEAAKSEGCAVYVVDDTGTGSLCSPPFDVVTKEGKGEATQWKNEKPVNHKNPMQPASQRRLIHIMTHYLSISVHSTVTYTTAAGDCAHHNENIA